MVVSLAFLLLFILLNSMSYAELTDKVRDEISWRLITHDYNGSTELLLFGVYLSEKTLEVVSEGEEGIKEIASFIGNRQAFLVYVQAYKKTYFYPTNFVLVQGNKQYKIQHGDYIALSSDVGGIMYEGVGTQLIITFPYDIDVRSSLKICYDENECTFKLPDKWYSEPSIAAVEQQKTIYCPKCENQIKEDWIICPYCGTSLKKE